MAVPTVSKDPLAQFAERQQWLTPELERSLQELVRDTINRLGGESLRRVLHGDWLNEPLHAILTDVPVGAWTATVAFDTVAALSSDKKLAATMDKAADATLVLGLLGAVGAAITGINDWAQIEKPAARKIGLVHAGINLAATCLFAASGFHRLRKERSIARFFAVTGYAAASVSAHLGGNLVYEHGIGVTAKSGGEVTDAMHG